MYQFSRFTTNETIQDYCHLKAHTFKLKNRSGGCGLESFGSGWEPLAGSNESSRSVNGGEFLDWVTAFQESFGQAYGTGYLSDVHGISLSVLCQSIHCLATCFMFLRNGTHKQVSVHKNRTTIKNWNGVKPICLQWNCQAKGEENFGKTSEEVAQNHNRSHGLICYRMMMIQFVKAFMALLKHSFSVRPKCTLEWYCSAVTQDLN